MRGFPKHLNSKADYYYIKENFPASKWKPHWQQLLDERFGWFWTNDLESAEEGITDDTHKVVENKGTDGTTTYAQYELKENPDAKIFRIGFTVEEVEAGLAEA